MREWLSKDFNPPADLAGRIGKKAVKRAKRRKAIERTLLFIVPFFLIGSFALMNNFYIDGDRPTTSGKSFLSGSGEILQGVNPRSDNQNDGPFRHPDSFFGANSPEGSSRFEAKRFFKGGTHEETIRMTASPSLKGQSDEGAIRMTASPSLTERFFKGGTHEETIRMTATPSLKGTSDEETIRMTSPFSHPDSSFGASSPEGSQHYATTEAIRVNKIDHSLEISWDGEGEFVVYKCDSPKFDRCSVADVVQGNRYLDKDDNCANIVYYRIEPLKKG